HGLANIDHRIVARRGTFHMRDLRHLLVAVAMVAAMPAQAASFNCSKAATAVERAICDNPELSELDSAAALYYRNAQDTLPGAKALLPRGPAPMLPPPNPRPRRGLPQGPLSKPPGRARQGAAGAAGRRADGLAGAVIPGRHHPADRPSA